jgi:hypothetical protein
VLLRRHPHELLLQMMEMMHRSSIATLFYCGEDRKTCCDNFCCMVVCVGVQVVRPPPRAAARVILSLV